MLEKIWHMHKKNIRCSLGLIAKIGVYIIGLWLIQSNKIGVYIILVILISFWSNKIGVYIMRQIKKLTWLQTCFLGDLGVIWCNSLGDSLFQIYVMNFVEIVFDFYLHITSHISQAFASCTHYTSYSLLNLVRYIVCDLVVAIQN